MNKAILFLFFTCCMVSAFAQTRYLDDIFTPIVAQQDVVYGQADALNFPYFSETSTSSQDLLVDIYEPLGDMETERPCIVYAHGGAFLAGSKTDLPVVKFCKAMAAKGYVVLSIEYRLGFNFTSGASAERAVYRGVQDMKTAIRYVKEEATNLGIDTSKIFAAGNSAGSVMAIHASYFDDAERVSIPSILATPDLGCLSCSGNTFTHNDRPLAIANLWGAIVDTTFITAADNVPAVSFHGTADDSVFPGEDHPFSFQTFPVMQGSDYLTARLENLNIETEYYKFYGQGHEPWGASGETLYFDTIVDKTAEFFYNFIGFPIGMRTLVASAMAINVFPNPATDFIKMEWQSETAEHMSVKVLNAVGQVVFYQKTQANAGLNILEIPMQHLPSGWYAVTLDGRLTRSSVAVLKR